VPVKSIDEIIRSRKYHPSVQVRLENAQKFRLKLQRYVTDLIEKNGPPVRQLESPDALRNSARKRAFFVSEQFAFQEAGRNGSAVHFHERPLAPGAEMMNRPRNQLFARAGLAENQNRGVGRSDGLQFFQNSPQGHAVTDDFLEIVFRANLILQIKFLLAQRLRPIRHPAEGERVFNGNGDLIGNMPEQFRIPLGEVFLTETRDHEGTERTAVRNERQTIG